MSDVPVDWVPSAAELAYWRFLRLTGRQLAAWYCVQEGAASMWARPREGWMRQIFRARHAGHEHVYVGEVLERFLTAKPESH